MRWLAVAQPKRPRLEVDKDRIFGLMHTLRRAFADVLGEGDLDAEAIPTNVIVPPVFNVDDSEEGFFTTSDSF